MQTIAFMLLGLVLGSFATALAHRVPLGKPWAVLKGDGSRSACPQCGHRLGMTDLIPVLSWFFLRGRCRYCRAKVGRRYPLIELTAAAACTLVFLTQGATVEAVIIAAFVPFLLAMATVDLERYILPNQLMAICGVLSAVLVGWRAWSEREVAVVGFGIAAALGYALLIWAVGRLVTKVLKRDALGLGDVKFFAVAGLALGFQALPAFLMLSGALGVALGAFWQIVRGQKIFPFGPALIASFYLLLVFT